MFVLFEIAMKQNMSKLMLMPNKPEPYKPLGFKGSWQNHKFIEKLLNPTMYKVLR